MFNARFALPVLTACLLAVAPRASADSLVAGGTTIAGEVKVVSPAGVEFQPAFAKDPMLVPWDNVEDLSSEGSFLLLYGEDQEVHAPISSFKEGKLQLGEAAVAPADLVSATALADAAPGWGERMRSTFRYWHGGFNVAFNVQQATTDNMGLMIGFHTLRAKGPTRFLFDAAYRFVTSNGPDTDEETLQDAAVAAVRGEYDLSKRFYLYGSTDVLYDSVQDLSLRAIPKAGAGYVVWQREPAEGVRDFLQVELGGGWVYESYMSTPDNDSDVDLDRQPAYENDYFTVAFGASSAVVLPRGITFDWRFDYLPSVSDFAGDYVIRTQAGLNIPLIAPVSARLAVLDTYDSTPSADAKKNSLVIDTGLSLDW